MIKYLYLVLIAALVAGVLATPSPSQPDPGELVGLGLPLYSICPVVEGGGRTTELAVLSTDEGPVQLTLFANGATTGSIGVAIGPTGAVVIPVVDVAAVGVVGGLVELPTGSSAAGSVVRGAASISVEPCVQTIPSQVFMTGGITAGEQDFTLHLMNPFAGEAVVSLTVTSEVGLESNPLFESVIVPSRGSTVLEFSQLAPGRERLSVRVDTSSGRVIAVGRQTGDGDGAVWNALAPAGDWFIPIPTGDLAQFVLVGNPSNVEVEYQIDTYGSDGFEAAALSGLIPAGGEVPVALSELASIRAMRVISSSPVVATLKMVSGPILAMTTGVTEPALRWLMPASLTPGAETSRVILLNPGLEDATVTVRSLREIPSRFPLTVPAESVVELALDAADGYLVEASAPVVPLLVVLGEEVGAAAIGVPLSDG